MKRLTLIAGMAFTLLSGGGASAQTGAEPVSPQKLALARALFDLQGGQKQMEATITTMYGAMFANLNKALPPDQKRFAVLMQKDIEAGEVSLIPSFIDAGVRIYARDLSEKELSDYIAFQESESGRSIRAKSPIIMRDVVTSIVPIVQTAMPSILQKVVVDVCAQASCTDTDRRVIADTMASAAEKHRS